MSVNDSGNGTGIWGIARLAAPALVALVLAGVALPWILDSGTAHLPAIGVGVSTESGSGPPAVAKIEVTSPPSKSTGTHHHLHSTAASAVPAQTPNPAGAGSSSAGSQAVASPVVHPARRSSTGPTRTAAPSSPVTKTTPRSQKPTPITEPAANIQGQDTKRDHEDRQSPAAASHHGLALGHQKHGFPGNAEGQGRPPRGPALGHGNHVPPGQARKEGRPPYGRALGHRNHVPPGLARGHGDSRGDDGDERGHHGSHGNHGGIPPGHADGSHGADSHGRGHGH